MWDTFIRLFHWSLAAGFTANALIVEEESTVHEWIRHAVVVLIVLRLIWGPIGSRHARFADFLPSLRAVLDRAQDIATGRHRIDLGNTPLRALMIVTCYCRPH